MRRGSRSGYPSSRREILDDVTSRRPAAPAAREFPEALGARPQLCSRGVTTGGALPVDWGERFRDGAPVIMDSIETSNADAKQLVDFATGLGLLAARILREGRDQVFPPSPAGVDVSAEERRNLAETGSELIPAEAGSVWRPPGRR